MKIVSAALCRFLFLFVLAGVCEAEEAQEKQDDSQNAPSSFPPLVPGVPSRLPREKQMQEETVAKALLVVHQDLTTTDKVENNDERMDNERMDKVCSFGLIPIFLYDNCILTSISTLIAGYLT
jgi:hypothetical protein